MKKIIYIAIFLSIIIVSRMIFGIQKIKKKLIDKIVHQMSDKELLGQMFMISYPGEQITNFALEFIREKNLGGIKIFGWNAKSLTMLIESINKAQAMSQK